MVVNIIDRNFSFLGQIDNYESLILTKKWHNIGSFELHLHEDTQYADKLQKENIIFTSENKAFVIMHREVSTADGSLVVKGLEIKSFLARWLVFPPTGQAYYRVNSNTETIIKTYVLATLTRKGINNIIVAPNQNRGMQTVYQSRYKNLADELEKLSLASGLRWDIYLDLENKQFIFDVFEGQDRTAGQNTLPPAIFSIEYDNVAEQTLIDSRMNYANTAIVAGQGEGENRAIEIVGDYNNGLDSFELFVDARDIEDDTDLPERGQQKLAEMQEVFSFDSQVLTDKNLVYEEDFKLGDLVTIQNTKWNITADRRITEVTEIYEENGFRLDIAFGESIPTIKDIIKQATDVPVAEGGSEGEPGPPGKDGQDGIGLQFTWNGAQLGIKREDETEYQFVNLQGPQGKSLEFTWNGTQLGIRQQGDTTYQYVDLKGPKGDTGDKGPKGDKPAHSWNGTQLRFENPDGTWGIYVNLKGDKGDKGDRGDTGPPGTTTWAGITDKPSTFPPDAHTHSKNDITDFPTKLPADGGDADTVDGKHFSDIQALIPTKLSALTKDINFDERYYTETEIDTKLAGKVDKVSGKGLSTNDFTNVYKNKLDGIEEGANKYIHPDTHPASMIVETSSKRFVSDVEKSKWNSKAETSDIPTKVSQLENDKNYVTQEELGDAGYGDMAKSVYDKDDDGIVDVAETVVGNEIQLGSYKLVYNSTTNSLDIEVVA